MTERLEGALFRRSPAGAAALSLIAVGLGAWGVVNSPLFGVERIRIEGARALSDEEVRSLAGVEPGTNLLRLSMNRITSAVERSPWVADAVARRSLPTTLVITVVERQPIGWLGDPDDALLVARDGTIVESLGAAPSDVPWLGAWSRPPGTGGRVASMSPEMRVAASMGLGLLRRFSAARMIDDGVELELRQGGIVRYGAPAAFGEKNRAVARMLAWAEEREVDVGWIDVRVPGAPTLRPMDRS